MNKEKFKSQAKTLFEEVQGGVNEVIDRIRDLIKEGSARRLIIKNKDGKTVFQTQLAVGVSGAALIGAMAPVISAIGMFAMFLNDYQILVEKEIEEDEYKVDAEIIEIEEDEEPEEKQKNKKEDAGESTDADEKEEKTVGKKKKPKK